MFHNSLGFGIHFVGSEAGKTGAGMRVEGRAGSEVLRDVRENAVRVWRKARWGGRCYASSWLTGNTKSLQNKDVFIDFLRQKLC